MPKKTMQETKATKSGTRELTETQLEEISGGPHFVTWDGPRYTGNHLEPKVQLPAGAGRYIKV